MKKIRIMHLLQSNRFSGAENVVAQIIAMFKNDSNIEMIYCSRDGQIREALEERGIKFISINELNAREVRRVISELKPDIIHAHDMRASFVASQACGRIPLISHIHNNNFDSRGISLKSLAYMLAAAKAKHVFWVSNSSFNGYIFHKFFAKKSSVLYNIIDVEALYQRMELDNNSYDYDVIYVGRLTYQKNPQMLMRVFENVVKKLPDIKICVVGTGDLEEEVKALGEKLNLLKNVEFLGFQGNPLKMLHDAKVMVMTSRWEGTPMCALEAMALGVPIVSTPTDGLMELIDDGKNGYFSNDDVDLSSKIVHILSDESVYTSMSSYTLEKSKHINDISQYKEQIMNAYEVCRNV